MVVFFSNQLQVVVLYLSHPVLEHQKPPNCDNKALEEYSWNSVKQEKKAVIENYFNHN